ncbi:MAG: 3-dehydroquinate synthase II [Promethearchaeota archaeon]
MKKIILNFMKKQANFKELVQEAFNKNLLNFLVSKETHADMLKIERVNLYTKEPDLTSNHYIFEDKAMLQKFIERNDRGHKNVGYCMDLKTKEDEKYIVDLSNNQEVDFIIVSAKDWKIIPFENLIAEMHRNDTDLIAAVKDLKEAELMLKTLEIGVDGVLITPKSVNDIIDIKNLIYNTFQITLTSAKVVNIETIPESERVCVDTTSLLSIGEGLLVGSTATGFSLVHSETFETQFVSSRPFRVNAGDVSAYVLVPDENPDKLYRTKYLSELKGGDKVLAVSYNGMARIVSVGRVKIETRPMLRFELEATKNNKNVQISCICQNAETIRLVEPSGKAKSVVDIRIGDEILVHLGPGATHFGTAIKETIIEK